MKVEKKVIFFVGASLTTVALLWVASFLILFIYTSDVGYNQVGRFSIFLLAFVFSVPTAVFSTLIILVARKTGFPAEHLSAIERIKMKVKKELIKVASVSSFLVSVYLFVVGLSILMSTVKGRLPSWFVPFVVISPLAIIIYTIGKSANVLSKVRRSIPELKEIKKEVIKERKVQEKTIRK